MKSAFVIRHVAFEDLGTFAPVLDAMGYAVSWHEAGQKPLTIREAVRADLLVVLGGPIGVYDSDAYPCVHEEIDAVRQRLAADAPTLGICLGSQIMAAALDARVYPGTNGKEIAWSPLQLSDVGAAGPLAEIGPQHTAVLHWHGDTFDLPPQARLLASTKQYPHQAFSVGRRGLALQFHPEVSKAGLESWFIGHTLEIGMTPGVSVAQLRADTARHAPTLAQCGPRFFRRWLTEVGT
jgi:GMP synthase (glutamine-hydrolysing)